MLLIYFIEYGLDELNNKHKKTAVNSTIQFFENRYQKKYLVKDFWPTHNSGQKVGDKFTKLSKIGFSMESFTAHFLHFFTKNCQNFEFKVDGWILAIKFKHFKDFFKFPSLQNLQIF